MPLRILILTSTEDLASTTIRAQLLNTYAFKLIDLKAEQHPEIVKSCHHFLLDMVEFTLWGTDTRMVQLDEFIRSDQIPADLIIFASRHRSQSARPALLCHTPGNWGEDVSVGGRPRQIAKGSGLLQYYFYMNLTRYVAARRFSFPVDPEVTHHGPTKFDQPVGFIELGSSEAEWQNTEGAQIVADALIDTGKVLGVNHFLANKWIKNNMKVCVGFGGTHYMPNFSRLISLNYGFAHVVPKYAVGSLNMEMIDQIQERVLEPIDYWIVDWKGLNSTEKNSLMPLLEATNIPIKKTKEVISE
jgi:D-aminoacyl-tRNA deacylase